jgi:hypothetical protein
VPEKDWERQGELPEGTKIGAVAASRDGFGLVDAIEEPEAEGLLERMRGRRTRLLRAAAGSFTPTWEGPGWVQALDCDGPLCAAIGATLKPSGSGSDYHLLVSTDGGLQWETRGQVDAPSVGQVLVVSAQEVWVLGASFLGLTTDGGASWTELEMEGERNPHAERLRRVEGGVSLLGPGGLGVSRDGGASWTFLDLEGLRLVDVDDSFVVAVAEGVVRVGERQGDDIRWLPPLPEGREPLRLVAEEDVLRVLTRAADPARGVDLAIHRSEDGGQTWSHHPLPLGPRVDIAGREWGIGVDPRGAVYGRVG